MTEHESEHSDEEAFADLPLKMQSALRDAFRPTQPIEAKVDQAILSQAREHFKQTKETVVDRKSSSYVLPALISFATVAAALFLVASLTINKGIDARQSQTARSTDKLDPNGTQLAREDLDRNGRVDILDAFLLARQLEQGDVNNAVWDLNRDGKVDQIDVQHAAALAVRLNNTTTKG